MELILNEDIRGRVCVIGYAPKAIAPRVNKITQAEDHAREMGGQVDIVFERKTFRAVSVALFDTPEDALAFKLRFGDKLHG